MKLTKIKMKCYDRDRQRTREEGGGGEEEDDEEEEKLIMTKRT